MIERGDEVVLRAEGIRRSFASGAGQLDVLRGVDLAIPPGAITAIVGASGSGKSTLLHCLGALDRPNEGRVSIRDTDLSSLDDTQLARLRNREVGFVFQFHHLLPDFSALENVMLPALIAGASRSDAESRAQSLLASVGLSERAEHAPGQLSGGEQQRVAVARALTNEPSVVLADEPSGNLDVAASQALHNLIDDLRKSVGVTFVIATHDPELASRADRVFALHEGRLAEADPHDPVSWVRKREGAVS
jgi:lipoprotein-releasing system ATP-binding protein